MPPREEEEGATTRATTTSSRGRRDDFEEEDDLDFDRTLALGKIFSFFFLSLSFGKTDSDFCRSLSLSKNTGSSGWLFIYYVGVIKILRREGYAECVFFYFLSFFTV
jgi:hypothetical protein